MSGTPRELEAIRQALARGWLSRSELAHASREQVALAIAARPVRLWELLRARYLNPAQVSFLEGGPSPADPRAAARSAAIQACRAALAEDPLFAPHAGIAFEPLDELGRGGMGVVERVRDLRLGREAACKRILRDAVSPRQIRRFRREVEITARLDHPAIPAVYEAGTDARGQHYFLMRLVRGCPLAERIAELHRRPLDPRSPALRELLEVLVRVGEAIRYAHGVGVIHRDLKPANVMIGREGEALVLDWGLARLVDQPADVEPELAEVEPVGNAEGLTRAGALLGTPGYLAPEQARGETAGEQADVFALGGLLCAVLTGKAPVVGASVYEVLLATVEGRIASPRQRSRRVPPELDAIAAQALAPELAARTPSAAAFVADLRAYLAGEEVAAFRYGAWRRLLRAIQRHPTRALALLLCGGALVLGLMSVSGAESRERARLIAEAAHAVQAGPPPGEGDAGQPMARALGRLQRARRWHDLDPTDPRAARAQYAAALELGDRAQAEAQWDLAREAFRLALGLGLDETEPRARRVACDAARNAERDRRTDELQGVLARVERGDAAQDPEGLTTAVFSLLRYPEPNTVRVLAEALDALSLRLRAAVEVTYLQAAEPQPEEARAGAGPIAGLSAAAAAWVALAPGKELDAAARDVLERARVRLEDRASRRLMPTQLHQARWGRRLLGAAQRQAVGAGALQAAGVIAEALGRLGIADGAVEPLGRYLAAEQDPERALPAERALARLGGDRALELLRWAQAR